MQGLSLADQLHNEDVNPIDPDDDLIFDSEVNDFESNAYDDHEMILHNEQRSMDYLMDQGLNDLIQGKAPTYMVNLIL
ncbi:unnamed protein product [Sphagnum jensenii]|jgi:hypothetical protein